LQKKLALTIIIAILVGSISVFALTLHPQPSETEHKTIVVPDDFRTIQGAIDNADLGDTIYVKAGIYEENILVNKSVSLIGESRENTVVNGNNQGSVMTLLADNISIAGFTLENSGPRWAEGGIEMENVSYCNISDNYVTTNQFGVWAESSTDNIISKNSFSNDGYGIGLYSSSDSNSISENNVTGSGHAGILLAACDNTNVSENNLTSNEFSVELITSSNNTILGNDVTNSSNGIAIFDSSNQNEIAENNIENNGWGLEMRMSTDNTIDHNNFVDNAPQVYFFDQNYSNVWDIGYPGGGNYWSNMNSTDLQSGPFQNETGSDGIADSPVTFNSYNEDHYPLMGKFQDFPIITPRSTGSTDKVDVISNFTVSNLSYQTWPNSSTPHIQQGQPLILIEIKSLKTESQTTGFCLLMITRTILNSSTYQVLLDWNPVNFAQLKTTNGTIDYLYFTFKESSHEIAITTPEFKSINAVALTDDERLFFS